MMKVLIIGLGGFLGSISRYGLHHLLDKKLSILFPYATFSVNMIGCLIIGVIYGLMQKNSVLSDEMRLFLAVGFCGSFTTYSTFAYENFLMLSQSEILSLLLYTTLSIVLGIVLVYVGYLAASYGSW